MTRDKKVVGGAIRWVLMEAMGRTVVRDNVPPDIVNTVLAELTR
jgi:3-dehydroquinate synthetase